MASNIHQLRQLLRQRAWRVLVVFLLLSLLLLLLIRSSQFADEFLWLGSFQHGSAGFGRRSYYRHVPVGRYQRAESAPSWRPVPGSLAGMHVYSAFFDARARPPLVRVVAGKYRTADEEVWCTFHPDPMTGKNDTHRLGRGGLGIRGAGSGRTSVTVKGSVRNHPMHVGMPYAVGLMTCPWPGNVVSQIEPDMDPSSVQVSVHARIAAASSETANTDSIDDEHTSNNKLPLLNAVVPEQDLPERQASIRKFGVCVRPMFNVYNETSLLVQFIEMYRILGASGFTFYNMSISEDIGCILRMYESKGILEILPWNLPWPGKILEAGQLAAANDCLYRNMWKYEYLAFVDVDEILIPNRHENLLEFINSAFPPAADTKSSPGGNETHVNKTGSVLFRNGYFLREWPDDDEAASADDFFGLPVIRKTRRKAVINGENGAAQTKFIAKSSTVVNPGIHVIEEFVEGYESRLVPIADGFMHHYRHSDDGGFQYDVLEDPSLVDRSAWRFLPQLLERLENSVALNLKNMCGVLI